VETFGDRLTRAVDLRYGSVRKFEREIKKQAPGLRGTSRQTLYRYINGESDPPDGFIATAAELLGVRREWLALGHGGRTEEEEQVRRARAVAVKPETFIEARIAAVFDEFSRLSIGNQSLVYEALTRFLARVPADWYDPDGRLHPDMYDLFLMGVRQAVGAPLKMWGQEDWESPRAQDYIRAALSAFILSIPERVEAQPVLVHVAVSLREEAEPTEEELRALVGQLRTAAESRGYDLGL
jgi:transcriptional regulator with XRE-family HTH domain